MKKALGKYLLKNSKNVMLAIAGTIILSISSALFTLPFELVIGGISSLAIIFNRLLPFSFITMDFLVTILTWGIFILGLFTLGKEFALKTLISTIFYPIGVSFFSKLVTTDVFGGFFNLKASAHGGISIILACLFGGLLTGTGCAVVFLGGGSTGGVDVLAFIICKHFKRLRSSKVIFYIDALIILTGMFVIRDLVITLLGIISAFIGALAIDKIFLGGKKAFNAQIVSEKYNEINEAVIKNLGRTTTIIKITGGYTKKDMVMVNVSFNLRQYANLIGIVNGIDKNAFITVMSAYEVNGEGWTR